jgi:hypothetical protein
MLKAAAAKWRNGENGAVMKYRKRGVKCRRGFGIENG